jgi:RNA polymerase sigma-70 factor (ECF subfamily)
MFLVLPIPEQPGLPDRVAPDTHDEPPLQPAALAAAFLADDAAAAWVLETHLLPLVTRLVHRLSAWSNDCDDLIQDVLVTALVKRKAFHAHARLETWITRITINRWRTHRRKQWLRSKLFRAWAERDAPSRPAAKTPEEFAVTGERAAAVRAAIAQLPAPSREAIVLCYLEGLTVSEAAEALAVRRGTLEVRLSRARTQLRDALAGMLDEHFAIISERGSDVG